MVRFILVLRTCGGAGGQAEGAERICVNQEHEKKGQQEAVLRSLCLQPARRPAANAPLQRCCARCGGPNPLCGSCSWWQQLLASSPCSSLHLLRLTLLPPLHMPHASCHLVSVCAAASRCSSQQAGIQASSWQQEQQEQRAGNRPNQCWSCNSCCTCAIAGLHHTAPSAPCRRGCGRGC